MAAISKMRINVAGFSGEALSVFAAYDRDTDVLLILRDAPYETVRRDGFLHLTTQAGDQNHDSIFEREHFREAIEAYFDASSMRALQLADTMARHGPESKLQRNGVDEKGPKYQIDPSITNGQVAVLLAAYYARQQRAIASSSSMFDALFEMHSI